TARAACRRSRRGASRARAARNLRRARTEARPPEARGRDGAAPGAQRGARTRSPRCIAPCAPCAELRPTRSGVPSAGAQHTRRAQPVAADSGWRVPGGSPRCSRAEQLRMGPVVIDSRPAMLPEKKQVLIVDDEPNLRKILAAQLSRDGYDVLLAEDGEQGLAFLRDHHIDLVVTDLKMPKLDGMSLLRQALAEHP